jgi:hypothetical protein
MGDKGAGATRWKTGLMLYNPADLEAVCSGAIQSWEPQPYAVFDFDRFSLKPEGGDGQAGGIAFDAATGHLFFIEHNGDPATGDGAVIHAWRLRAVGDALKISAHLDNHSLVLQWDAPADGSSQQVQRTSSLGVAATWAGVGAIYLGDGARKVFTEEISTASQTCFFRVIVLPGE